jgi:hypothetical protein
MKVLAHAGSRRQFLRLPLPQQRRYGCAPIRFTRSMRAITWCV